MRIDLDQVEAVINRPHVIDLRDDGFTIMHPPACHPNLFACPLNLVTRDNLEDTGLRGQYECELDFDGEFAIGEPIEDAPGVDWTALVAELRAARDEIRWANNLLDRYGAPTTIYNPYDRVEQPLNIAGRISKLLDPGNQGFAAAEEASG